MESIIADVKLYIDLLAHVVLSAVAFATAVVRLTPSKSDDEKVNKLIKKVQKLFSYLPTVGINPRTEELEKLVEQQKK